MKTKLPTLALLVAMPAAVHGLQIQSPSAASNFLYSGNWNASPTNGATQTRNTNADFVGSGYDLSSVGWISGLGTTTTRVNHVTLVAPTHVFQAKHMAVNALPNGRILHFVGSDARATSTTVEQLHQYLADSPTDAQYTNIYANDLVLARVSRALTTDDKVSVARLLDAPSFSYEFSPSLLVFGSQNDTNGSRVGRSFVLPRTLPSNLVPIQVAFNASQIAWYGVRSKAAAAPYNPTCPPGFAITAESGDSGSPAFIAYTPTQGSPAALLVGSHWGFNQLGSILPAAIAASDSFYRSNVTTPYATGLYNPVTPLNRTLRSYGYALKWTILDSPVSQSFAGVSVSADALPVPDTNTAWLTGMPVIASGVSGFVGLTNGTYWIIRDGSAGVRLASSPGDARNLIAMPISGTGSVTLTHVNTASVWTGAADSSLGLAVNWRKAQGVAATSSPATIYNASAVRAFEPAVFDAGVSPLSVTLNASSSLGLRGALFKSSTNPAGFTFNGTGPLAVDYSGLRNEANATQTFNVPVILTASQNWEAVGGPIVCNGAVSFPSGFPAGSGDDTAHVLVVAGPQNTTIGGPISGAGSLAKDDQGTLTLLGTNTYAGDTFVHAGTLTLGPSASLPGNTRLRFVTGNPTVVDLNNRPHTFTQISSEQGVTSASEIRLGTGSGGGLTLNTTTNTTYGGRVSGNGPFTKLGAGTWTVGGLMNNGAVAISAGAVVLTGPIGTNTSPVSVSAGARLILGGNTSMPYFSTTLDTTRSIAPGAPVGILETGAQTWSNGGEYAWQIGSLTGNPGLQWDLLRISNGALQVSAGAGGFTVRISPVGTLEGWNPALPYSWKIAEAAGGIAGFDAGKVNLDVAAFSAVQPLNGGVFSLRPDGTELFLDFVPGLPGDFSPGAGSVTNGLVSFWKFDEGAGAAVADAGRSTTLRPLTITTPASTPWVTSGRFDSALDFTGVATTGATFSSPELTAISFSAWVWQDTRGTFPRILELNGFKVLIRSDWNSIGFNSARTGTTAAADWRADATIPTGSWQHIVVTYDGSSNGNAPVFYLNGVRQGTLVITAPSGSLAANAGTGYIGNRADGARPYDGRLDQVRLYNRVLTDAEVTRLYHDSALAAPTAVSAAPVMGGIQLAWTAPAGTGLTYKVARATSAAGPFAFVGAPTSATTLLDTTATPGSTHFYTVTAGASGLGGEISAVASATAWTALQSWRQQSFGTAGTNGLAADTADPDNDGAPNLIEYATAGNPIAAGSPATRLVQSGASRSLSFNQVADPNLTYMVEVSPDLKQWTNIWTGPPMTNAVEGTTVPIPTNSAPAVFMRLRVTAP